MSKTSVSTNTGRLWHWSIGQLEFAELVEAKQIADIGNWESVGRLLTKQQCGSITIWESDFFFMGQGR